MNSLWKKLTTKPVWYLERHRNYAIRRLGANLPSISCLPSGTTLAVLTTPSTFDDSLWSAWSWLRYLGDLVALKIVVDGQAANEQRELVSRLFPNGILITAEDQLKQSPVEGKNLEVFSQKYRLGRKVSLIISLQNEGPLLYSDYDVLVFGEPAEIRQAIVCASAEGLFNQQPLSGAFDPLMTATGRALGLHCPEGFNSGLLWIPRQHLSMELADHLLRDWHPDSSHAWFTEQTVLGLLMSEKGAAALPPDRYVVTMQRQFYWEPDVDYDAIAVRHFIYPVRHVMHIKGQPWLLSKARNFNVSTSQTCSEPVK